MKRITTTTAFLCLCMLLIAQDLQLRGRIVSGKEPVEFANVILQTKDSIFISGGITDQRGRFNMNNLQKGNYQLRISGLGYQTQQINLNDFTTTLDLGSISIDSAAIALEEVTITANPVINQPDRKIILPSARQLKTSTNGLSLLQRLQLSRIQVDPIRQTITSSNQGDVQLRINGAKVEIQEILALQPEDVIRIEYHDEPGLRYGDNAAAVIDYIVRRHQTGGYVGFDTSTSVNTLLGNNNATAKINHKNSEWGINYHEGYRSFKNYWRENSETFHFSDKPSFTRLEDGVPDKMKMRWDYLTMNYSYQEAEKWFVSVALRGSFRYNKLNTQSTLYPIDNPDNSVAMKDHTASDSKSPSIDIYLQRNLKNNQAIILNTVGTYIHTYDDRTYEEKKHSILATDIYSAIRGKKYSFIGEGIYEKKFTNSKLSAGIRHQQSLTENKYAGTSSAETRMQEAHTSTYIEYSSKIKRFNYSVGVQDSRSWFNQEGEGYQKYSVLPRIRLTYNFSDQAFIRYQGQISRSTPALSDLSNVEQLIDSLQIRRGNPTLKMSTVYNNTLNVDFRKGLFSSSLYLLYQYQHKPNMEETFREGELFVRTTANQRSWQKLNPEVEIKVGPIKDILSLSISTGINYFDSRGHNYHHTYTNWYYCASATAAYKKWSAYFEIRNHRNDFYGETLSYGENYHLLSVSYRYKQLNVGVMSLNPFGSNYRIGSENFSPLAPSKNWMYIKESSRVFALTLSWNFSFGRKYESAERRLHNEDNNAGTLKSGK